MSWEKLKQMCEDATEKNKKCEELFRQPTGEEVVSN